MVDRLASTIGEERPTPTESVPTTAVGNPASGRRATGRRPGCIRPRSLLATLRGVPASTVPAPVCRPRPPPSVATGAPTTRPARCPIRRSPDDGRWYAWGVNYRVDERIAPNARAASFPVHSLSDKQLRAQPEIAAYVRLRASGRIAAARAPQRKSAPYKRLRARGPPSAAASATPVARPSGRRPPTGMTPPWGTRAKARNHVDSRRIKSQIPYMYDSQAADTGPML